MDVFNIRLGLFIDLFSDIAFYDRVLAGGVQALQYEYTLLLEVVSECLLLPALQANHLVLDFVNSGLVPFQCDLSQD